jgi:hypothetical protein
MHFIYKIKLKQDFIFNFEIFMKRHHIEFDHDLIRYTPRNLVWTIVLLADFDISSIQNLDYILDVEFVKIQEAAVAERQLA